MHLHRRLQVFTDHTVVSPADRAWSEVCAQIQAARTLTPPLAHDAIVSAVIEAGRFEAAVADALCPSVDSPHWMLERLRRITTACARAVIASWQRGETDRHLADALAGLHRLTVDALPSTLHLKTAEGFAFYALYPESYIEAALDWAGSAEPRPVVCLGLRSIGTALSAVVAAALETCRRDVQTWTLRPHGHPFDRRVHLTRDLTDRWNVERATFLIVDEGPGLSGSSLAGAAAALSALGVPDDRIVFFTAFHPDPSRLVSSAARERFTRHRLVSGELERVRARVFGAVGIPAPAIDVSGGRWREYFLAGMPWPAAHPQHERVKALIPGARMAKFSGLGTSGTRVFARAERLAGAGWTLPPTAMRAGFLTMPVAGGRPVERRDIDDGFLAHAAAYVAWLRAFEQTTTPVDVVPLADMLIANSREALGDAAAQAAERLSVSTAGFDEPAVAVDGRMLLHEWVQSNGRFVKLDALDHHCDHFLPGTTDAAWDVAGLIVEAPLRDGARDRFVEAYRRASGDRTIARRLPFYVAAYAAFRLGYCAMAGSVPDRDERARFGIDRARYARALSRALNVTPSAREASTPAV